MRAFASLLVIVALAFPAPLSMGVAAIAPEAHPGHTDSEHTAHRAGHEKPAASPGQHDSADIPDCCFGSACFSVSLTEAIDLIGGVGRPPLATCVVAHRASVAHPPDLPPPRL